MRTVISSLILLSGGPAAMAEISDSPWDVEAEAELALVIGAAEGDEAAAMDMEHGLWEASFGVSAERTLQSGITIGGRAVMRAARDHAARPAGTGNLALAPMQGPAGAYSQVALGPELADGSARASLESAYLYIETGYGEVSLGRDVGVAARFQEGDVSVLSRASLVDPYLDPSGLAVISTRPDVTGPSHKISYVTPRLLGVRAGLSYTPEADIRGLDRDATGDPAAGRPGLESVVELGVNVSRRLRESGVRLRGGAGYVTGEVTAPFGFEADYEDRMDLFFAGGEVEWADHYRFGLNWLSADEALTLDQNYTAWSAGFGYERGDWAASLTYGESDLESLGGESQGVSLALRKNFSDNLAISVAYQDRSLDIADPAGVSLTGGRAGMDGVVIEITLGFEK